MARPIRKLVPVLSDDADGICASQSPTGAGALTLNGALVNDIGYGVPPAAQPLEITSDGNDSGNTFTVTGLDPNGITVSEDITGPSSTTVVSTYYYSRIDSIVIDGAATGNITSGFSASRGMKSSAIPLNVKQTPFNVALQFDLTAGTMTVDVEYTMDDPQGAYATSFDVNANWTNVTGMGAITSDTVSNFAFGCTAVRLKQTTGSTTGACTLTVIQGA